MRLSNPLLLASLGVLFAAASCTLITDVDRSKIPDGQAGAPVNGGDGSVQPQAGQPNNGGSPSMGGSANPGGGQPQGGAPEPAGGTTGMAGAPDLGGAAGMGVAGMSGAAPVI